MRLRSLPLFVALLFCATVSFAEPLGDALQKDFQAIDGTVVLAVPGQVLIDKDASAGISEGDLFAVIRPGAEIVHPTTGAKLGRQQVTAGWLRATRLQKGYSEAATVTPALTAVAGDPIRRYDGVEALLLDTNAERSSLYATLQAALPQLRWLGYYTDPALVPTAGSAPRLVFAPAGNILEVREPASGLLRRYPLLPVTAAVRPAPTAQPGAALPTPNLSTYWNGPSGQGLVSGVAFADLNGDNKNEIVVAGLHTLEVGQLIGQTFERIAGIDLGLTRNILGIDALDTDGDGKAELWITASRDADLDSAVYRLQGTKLIPAADHLGFWLRRLDLPGAAPAIYGQRMGVADFAGPIVQLAFREGKIVESQSDLPADLPLFGMTRIGTPEAPVTVRLTAGDKLQAVAKNGEVLQESDEFYGGSERFIPRPDPRRSGVDADTRNAWAPPRLVAAGENLVLVPANLGSRSLARQRDFKQSRLDLLAWDGFSLRPIDSGRTEPGYLVDFALADVDNDGKTEIATLLQTGKPGLGGSGRWIVVVRENPLP